MTADAAITAGKSAMSAGDDGPIAVTLASAGKALPWLPARTLTLGATDDYSLAVAGAAIDDGAGGRGRKPRPRRRQRLAP